MFCPCLTTDLRPCFSYWSSEDRQWTVLTAWVWSQSCRIQIPALLSPGSAPYLTEFHFFQPRDNKSHHSTHPRIFTWVGMKLQTSSSKYTAWHPQAQKPLLLRVWSMGWHAPIIGALVRKAEPQAVTQTCWIRICIFNTISRVICMHKTAWETLLQITFYIILISTVDHKHFLHKFQQLRDKILREDNLPICTLNQSPHISSGYHTQLRVTSSLEVECRGQMPYRCLLLDTKAWSVQNALILNTACFSFDKKLVV